MELAEIQKTAGKSCILDLEHGYVDKMSEQHHYRD